MKIVQANVGRSGSAHDLLLSYNVDIILVQEPWTNMTKHLTKTQPRYKLFSPATRWEPRPRALIYVRRDLPAYSLPQATSPDIAAIYTAGLTIINVYRPPHDPVTLVGSDTTPSTLRTLLQFSPPRKIILAGNFNTHHPLWQPGTESHKITAGATALIEWLETHDLALGIESDTPTRGKSTLDLVFSNMLIKATMEDYLDTSSDHATILTLIGEKEPAPRPV